MDEARENLIRAGELFMCTVWLQSQMSDLLIMRKNPHLVAPFVDNPERVPSEMATIRTKYWERYFGSVKEEFVSTFKSDLFEDELKDLEVLFHTRNMIAHAHVSVERKYMLYRPAGGPKKEKALIEALSLQPVENQAKPLQVLLEYWKDEQYLSVFARIKRLDEVCFERICTLMSVPHGRIR